MRLTSPAGFRAGCAAVALFIGAMARAAEPHPLMGASRDDVLAKYGEPTGTLVGGGREVLLYAKERLVLRDGKVVDVERVVAAPVRQPRPQPVAPAATTTAPGAETTAPVAPATKGAAPVVPVQNFPLAPAEATRPQPAPPAITDAGGPAPAQPAATPEPEPPPEPKLEIKRVLPRSTKSAPTQIRPTDTAPVAVTPKGAAPAVTPPVATATTTTETAPTSPPTPLAQSTTPATVVPTATTEPVPAPAAPEEDPELAKKEKAKRALDVKAARRRLEAASADASYDPTSAFLNKQTYLIAALIVFGGIAYIVWRRRQQQIALIATAVSREPFAGHAEVRGSGAVFTAELLGKLEWKHFEDLVAAYYNKTGVVATRTKAGPNAPVHLKISWKGESRPFALVQCIAQPAGLVAAKSLQELSDVLVKEDIRRGYVVSAGKFSVPARDVAEEKHLTLLPGDIFLEKLNALPDLARNEIMQTVTTGDYTTPVCPKCEARMVRAPEDPNLYRCATHFDQQIAAKKPVP